MNTRLEFIEHLLKYSDSERQGYYAERQGYYAEIATLLRERDNLLECAERDQQRIAELLDALVRLAVDCEDYMRNYEKLGGGHIMTGRCWDKMRKATVAAAITLDKDNANAPD